MLQNVAAYCGNNSIQNSTDVDIISINSSLVVLNNTLNSGSPFGISARDCDLFVLSTTFNESYVAMGLSNTEVIMINSTVLNNASGKFELYRETKEKCHFLLEDNSTIRIKNTVFDEDEVIFEDY